MNKYRNIVSVITGISFFIVGLSGVLMKFVLKAHWLNEAHTWIGFVMVAAALLHLLLNWKPFVGYFSNRWMYFAVIPFLALVLVFVRQSSDGGGARQGMGAVIGKVMQAKTSDLAPVLGKSPDQLVSQMRQAGLTVNSADQTIAQIGRANHRPPQMVLSAIGQ